MIGAGTFSSISALEDRPSSGAPAPPERGSNLAVGDVLKCVCGDLHMVEVAPTDRLSRPVVACPAISALTPLADRRFTALFRDGNYVEIERVW